MALKQQQTDELVTNGMKLVQNCHSDKENQKYNGEIPTVTWPPLQCKKASENPITPTPLVPPICEFTCISSSERNAVSPAKHLCLTVRDIKPVE